MTPADLIIAFLGRGPANRMALIGMMLGRGYDYPKAEYECGQAILALVRAGRIESFQGDVWRLGATAKFEDDSTTKAERATKATGGYRNYQKPAQDATPVIGAPCMDQDGE